MVHITCPQCGRGMHVDETFRGGVCRCEECEALISVPNGSPSEADAERPSGDRATATRPDAPPDARRSKRPERPDAPPAPVTSKRSTDPVRVRPDLPPAPTGAARSTQRIYTDTARLSATSTIARQRRQARSMLYIFLGLLAVVVVMLGGFFALLGGSGDKPRASNPAGADASNPIDDEKIIPGLVAHWLHAGDLSDRTGRHTKATAHGEPEFVEGHNGGQALRFDGIDDYVDTGFKADLTRWTVAFWVKAPLPREGPPTGPIHREKNLQISWNHVDSSMRGAALVHTSNGWQSVRFGRLFPDTWQHVAASYDGETLRAYLDGKLVSQNPRPSGDPSGEDLTLKLGRHAEGDAFFKGDLQDVRLYERALSADDVQQLYERD